MGVPDLGGAVRKGSGPPRGGECLGPDGGGPPKRPRYGAAAPKRQAGCRRGARAAPGNDIGAKPTACPRVDRPIHQSLDSRPGWDFRGSLRVPPPGLRRTRGIRQLPWPPESSDSESGDREPAVTPPLRGATGGRTAPSISSVRPRSRRFPSLGRPGRPFPPKAESPCVVPSPRASVSS